MTEIESRKTAGQSGSDEQTDAMLLGQFEAMTGENGDPQLASEISKLAEIKVGLHEYFPSSVDDVLLSGLSI